VIEFAFFRGMIHIEMAETLHLPLGTIKPCIPLSMAQLNHLCPEMFTAVRIFEATYFGENGYSSLRDYTSNRRLYLIQVKHSCRMVKLCFNVKQGTKLRVSMRRN
jgi:hypothetical protein